jgi:hypothetical protein
MSTQQKKKGKGCPFGRAVADELAALFAFDRKDIEETGGKELAPLPKSVTVRKDACMEAFTAGVEAEKAGDVETAFLHYREAKTAFHAFVEALFDFAEEEYEQSAGTGGAA